MRSVRRSVLLLGSLLLSALLLRHQPARPYAPKLRFLT
jgi:hypothetical protein